jgi:hypothetical protein
LFFPIFTFVNGLNAAEYILCWLLLLEDYGVTFEYLPANQQKNVVVDALSHLVIDILKLHEEDALTLLSGSKNNSISNDSRSTFFNH